MVDEAVDAFDDDDAGEHHRTGHRDCPPRSSQSVQAVPVSAR